MLRYLEVKEEVKETISKLGPGSRIPSRNFLCRKYEVARNTIDKAIAELEEEGYVTSVKGSGTFVSEDNPQKTINIGVILPSVMEDIFPRFIFGIEQYASSHSINIVLFSSDQSPDRQRNNVQRAIEMRVDGCIIIPTLNSEQSYDTFRKLRDKKIPFVLCYRSVDGLDVPFVGVNNCYGAYIATRHLMECGCGKISYFSDKKYSVALERYYGYETAMLENVGKVKRGEVILGNYGEEELREEIRKIFRSDDCPDGVLCFDDNTAASLCAVLIEKGLKPGEDVRIVGNNNSDLCNKLIVPLSSVSSRSSTMGKEAVKLLMRELNGEECEMPLSLLYPELYVRESSIGKQAGM